MKIIMSDRWGNLRDRFKTKNIDLDAEFEKFLNEVSLSLRTTKTIMLIYAPYRRNFLLP